MDIDYISMGRGCAGSRNGIIDQYRDIIADGAGNGTYTEMSTLRGIHHYSQTLEIMKNETINATVQIMKLKTRVCILVQGKDEPGVEFAMGIEQECADLRATTSYDTAPLITMTSE